jgi:PadR family transcriptional regulator PadR
MSDTRLDLLQGTLDLMVLQTLAAMGELHGYGIARRIEQVSGNLVSVKYGTLDPALLKLEQEGYISSAWGISDNNRRAKFSGDTILLNQGTIYASLVRLQNRGWISAAWGTSENNRKAKYYALTRSGRKQLARDAADWHRLADVMGRVLSQSPDGAQ